MDRESRLEGIRDAIVGCFEAPKGSKNSLADCRAKPFDRWNANKPIVLDQSKIHLQQHKYLTISMRSVPGSDECDWRGFLAYDGRGCVYEVELHFQAPVWTAPVFQMRGLGDLSDEDLWVIGRDLSRLIDTYSSTRLAEGTKAQIDGAKLHEVLLEAPSPPS